MIDAADRDVYGLIQDRQRAVLGADSDAYLGAESGDIVRNERMYRFNPRPVDADLPEAFVAAPPEFADTPPDEPLDPAAEPMTRSAQPGELVAEEVDPVAAMTDSIFASEQLDQVTTFGLQDALAYAMKNGRDLQTAKEDLYVAALDLTLERHLWTPQFVATITARADFADPGLGRDDEDDAFEAISDVAVSQQLPYGGSLTAQILNTLLHDLDEHVTAAENGSLILEAEIPLFRGAGRVAYESRFAAERELIYAARRFERFRRAFVVRVAGDYFNLQELKAAVYNTLRAYQSRYADWEKADFMQEMGRSRTIFEAPRAKASLRQAEASLVSSKERFAAALDRFKIVLGMPVDVLLDVLEQGTDAAARAVDGMLPDVDERLATETALKYRLDLLNVADAVDDARRGVVIAENNILPRLNVTGSAAFDSDPLRFNSTAFNTERAAYSAGIELRMDDRKAERNAYRASLIGLRRSNRNYEEFQDTVRADVMRAMRRVAQQENLRRIQALNVEENALRLAAARAQFDLGKSTNQDVVDAENDLLAARNQLAAAVSAFRVAILEFRRDTGTLRLTYDGRLALGPPEENAPPPEDGPTGP